MLKKSLSWLLTMFMLLSCITVVSAERTGVSGITWALADGVYTVTWTNPADEDFEKNELYKYNGSTFELSLDLGTATTTTVTAVSGENRYMIKSYFTTGETVDVYTGKYKSYTDTTTFPGLKLDLWNNYTTTGDLNGAVGVTYDEAYSGDKSAFLQMDHGYQSMVYYDLYQTFGGIEHGQKYCFSFWVKVPEGTATYTFDYKNSILSSSFKNVSLGANHDLKDGEWHNIKSYFVTDGKTYNPAGATASTTVAIRITRLGTLYVDDFEIYMVDENNKRYGADDALKKAGTFEDKKGVTNFTVDADQNYADANPTLKWTNPTDGEIEHNDIFVSFNGGDRIPVATLGSGVTTYTDTGRATKHGVYTYTIKTKYANEDTTVETSASRAIFVGSKEIYGGWYMQTNEPALNVIMPRTNRIAPTTEKYSSGEGSLKVYRPHRRSPDMSYGDTYMYRTISNLDANSQYTYSFDYYTNMYEAGVYPRSSNKKIGKASDQKEKWVTYSETFSGVTSKAVGLYFDWSGTLYLDNVKLVKVGEEDVNLLETVLGMDCNYDLTGVSSFAYTSHDKNTINLTWPNPVIAEVDKNELYVVENGTRRLVTTFENGETAYTYEGAEAGAKYDFVMISYFGEVQKESALTAYAKRNTENTTYLPGWTINYRDPNTERFRGQIGVDCNTKIEGNSSLFVELENTATSNYYVQLYRYLSNIDKDKSYRVSGYIKGEGFGADNSRVQILLGLGLADQDQSYKIDMTQCSEWTPFEFVQTVNTSNETLSILMDSQGKVWLDDLEIYEVEEIDGQWYEVVDATDLLAGYEKDDELVIGGDFEYKVDVVPLFVGGDAEEKTAFAELFVDNSVALNPETKLIIAVYNPSGKLVKVETTAWKDAQKDAGEAPVEFVSKQHYVTLGTDSYEDGYEVKVFVWNEMLPLCATMSNEDISEE